jgi:hypothetical protein
MRLLAALLISSLAACGGAPRPLTYDAYAAKLLAQHRKHRSVGRVARTELTRNDRIDAGARVWLDPSVRAYYGAGQWNLRSLVNDWLCFETQIASGLHADMVRNPLTPAQLDAIDQRDLAAYRARMWFTLVLAPQPPAYEQAWPTGDRNAIDDIQVTRGDFIGRARDRHWQRLTLCGPAPAVPDDARYLGLVIAGADTGPQLVLWELVDDAASGP